MICSGVKSKSKFMTRINKDIDDLFRSYSIQNSDGSWSENFKLSQFEHKDLNYITTYIYEPSGQDSMINHPMSKYEE